MRITNEAILEKTYYTASSDPHPLPRIEYGAGSNLLLEGGGTQHKDFLFGEGTQRFPSPSRGGEGWGWG